MLNLLLLLVFLHASPVSMSMYPEGQSCSFSVEVLVLDDSPAGLDAAAAASIMKFLKELAVAANIAIV
jgi:hypothetical protein